MNKKRIVNQGGSYRRVASSLFYLSVLAVGLFCTASVCAANPSRSMKYTSRTPAEATLWQSALREKLFGILKMEDLVVLHNRIALNPTEFSSEDKGDYILKEVGFNSTQDRRITVIVTMPKKSKGTFPAVVCIHGHGGKISSVYDKGSIYKGFAAELASKNFVTIAPVVSQHVVCEKDRMLMGERLWDLIRCVDYLESLREVDKDRIGCAGLSLGGEMSMWLGAMDVRIKAAVSSGFLTRMDQMEKNHCMCWKFPGLRELVDWADVYSMIAPRPLQCQNGLKEPANDFTVTLAREALKEIELIYADFKKPENVALDVHQGAHEIDLPALLNFFDNFLQSKK